MVKELRLTMQEVVDYMYIKDAEDYSQEELVAGFCLVGTKKLPETFTEQFLSVIAVHEDTRERFDREKLVSRLKTELGEEVYEKRFIEFLEDAVRLFAHNTVKYIKDNEHYTRRAIYTNDRMHRVKVAVIMNYSFTESRVQRRELNRIFTDIMQEELRDEQERYIANRIINELKYDGWGID